ncbi:hypothetical protein HC891_18775 [Candidatus Gracilibacteria bacterium]|nr:hypothetical protein [Candidatus Gracilibacteria bacterium]
MKRQRLIPALVAALVGALLVAAMVFSFTGNQPSQAEELPPILTYPDDPTPTTGPAPTAPASLASTTLGENSFDDESALNAITAVDLDEVLDEQQGNWRVNDGRLEQYYSGVANTSSIHQVAALLGDASWNEYTVRASFYDRTNGVAGLVAYFDGESYYLLRLLKAEYEDTPRLAIVKVVAGVETELAALDGPGFSTYTWHTMELSVSAGVLSASFNGQNVLTATDPAPLSGGQAGVYTRAFGGMLFDDVRVVTP